jgi:predicted MFS family arabinose efflux permease
MAVVVFGAITTLSLGTEPAITTQLERELRLPSHVAGLLVGTEFVASMLAALPAAMLCRRASPRRVAVISALTFLLANLCAGFDAAVPALFIWRALSGFAGGALLVAVLATAARCQNPDRVYAIWVTGQTLASAAALDLLPPLLQTHGLRSVYLLMAFATVLALPLLRSLWRQPSPPTAARPAEPGRRSETLGALSVLGLFYAVASGTWAFAADRGATSGLVSSQVSAWLAAANIAGIGGALLAAWIGQSRARTLLIVAGHGQMVIVLGLLASANSAIAFAVFALLLQFAWSFTAPFLLAQAAVAGQPDETMGAASCVMGAGLAVGPILTGALLERQGGYPLAAAGSGVLLVAALLLLAWLVSTGRTRARTKA